MNDWPVGLSTGCFYQTSIFECLPWIRESGFSIVEVCFSPVHLDYHDRAAVARAGNLLQQLGMEVYSFHAPFAVHIDISAPDPAVRDIARCEILRAAEAAAALRARYFVLHPGPEQTNSRPPEELALRMQNTAAELDRVNVRCQELGLACVLENKLPHLLFGNTADVLRILNAMKTSGMGVCLDTGHAFLAGELSHLVQRLAGHLRMIHAHDNGGGRDDHQPPGDGRIDWARLSRELAAIRFDGAFILELAGAGDHAATMANARRGRSYLQELSRGDAFGGDPRKMEHSN